jgi:hypothetical protein
MHVHSYADICADHLATAFFLYSKYLCVDLNILQQKCDLENYINIRREIYIY